MTERTADEIRTSVSNAYANRVRPVLERATATPVAEAACCGPDCCSSDAAPAATIQLIDITPAANDAACCDTSSGDCRGNDAGTDVEIVNIARLYKNTDITDLPSTVTDVAFGCGNPTAIAALQPGETVLDLGSGGGIDCFLAGKMVGPSGEESSPAAALAGRLPGNCFSLLTTFFAAEPTVFRRSRCTRPRSLALRVG